MADAKTTFPTQPQLLEGAIAHVRKIFKGNGVKAESIQILSGGLSHHTLNAGTYLELKPIVTEKQSPGRSVIGQQVGNRDEATQKIEQSMSSAAREPATRARITDVLLRRPDQGFGLARQQMPIDFLTKEYSWHEGCATCGATAKTPCLKCQGRRVETCIQCTGRGLMACPLCRTSGLVQGVKCTKCHGQRYVPCIGCQRSGMMPCRLCAATGAVKCQTCNGAGWKTHVLSLMAQALTYFEFDPKSIPKGAADMVESHGAKLVTDGKIRVKGRIADDRENVLGASYEVDFPYGEVTFQIGKREAKANLFGFKGDIAEFPHLLDKMLMGTVEDLERAAKDIGSVSASIKKATRFRLIAQAYLGVSRVGVRNTAAQLMRIYDIGLGPSTAERIARLAERTTSQITKKPRVHGLFYGLASTMFLMAGYYLSPVRTLLGTYLPDLKFDIVLDMLPVIICGIVTTLIIQMNAVGAVKNALGHLLKKNAEENLMPGAGHLGWAGYGGALVITIVMIEISGQIGQSLPYWYQLIRTAVLPT